MMRIPGVSDVAGLVPGLGGGGRLPDVEVSGSLAVVTGAAGGMGEHIAKGLARRGGDLVLLDRDAAGLKRVAGEIAELWPELTVTTYEVDLSDRAATDKVIARIVDAHPAVSLLFNNAGVALGGEFTQVSAEDFDWLLEINLLAPIRFCRALLPLMIENGGGQIVNTSSLFGLVGPSGQTAYSTSKFGLRGFSEALRNELESLDAPVGVTSVHPGGIKTNIAVNARVADTVDPEKAASEKRAFAKMLSYPAEKAAEEIVEAAIHRAPRLLIGNDAKALDVLARVTPGSYWGLMQRGMALAARRS